MTDLTPNDLSPQDVPNNSARCLGSGSYEDGKWHWREGCDDCQRRALEAAVWITPPPIIAFECEYRIGPDEIVAQGEHAPIPEPLSPAAQAVDHAIAARIYLLGEIAPSKQVVAAAIRVAAHHLQRCSPWSNDDPGSIPVDWCTSELHDIATELENAQ